MMEAAGASSREDNRQTAMELSSTQGISVRLRLGRSIRIHNFGGYKLSVDVGVLSLECM